MIRLKRVYFLTAFLMGVLFPVFLGAAELPPYQKYQGPIKPGIVINAQNWSQYLPELEKLLPPSKLIWYGIGVKNGHVTMPIVEPRYFPLSRGVLKATKKYEGQCKTGPRNTLIGWVAGVPFPNPTNAMELAWDAQGDVSRASSHDDTLFYCWFGLFKGDTYEKHFAWQVRKKKYIGRCEIPPMPRMPEAESVGMASKEFGNVEFRRPE